ncbi:putative Cathepsin D [Glarea lozoyensis 74030]|uniref:Putative Cathepsin D n=1 Tax=Glarea lozoyensis (strain ATCC 74030 / MF5533) TaxID=1104152 RepID=H0EL00_GLAL7|nr:putative Cathepsin D [Glarea lozoyensis 74030]
MCPNPSCPKGADAIQTLGGYSPALARKGLSWYDIVEVPEVNEIDFVFAPGVYSYWSIGLSGLYIGNQAQKLNTTAALTKEGVPAAIFDHASKGRGVPLSVDAYANLVKIAGGKPIAPNSPLLTPYAPNNGPQPFFSIDCKKTKTLPVISYAFTGSRKQWSVQPSEAIGEGSFLLGNFGDNFLKGKYVVFDYASQRVGLAEL